MENQINKKRVSRFAVVGIFNTLFDFAILNSLVFVLGQKTIIANIISGTIAATVSFFLNHSFVFKQGDKRTLRKFVTFICITMVGLYGLQNLIIFVLTHYFTAPADWCFDILNCLSADTFSREFVRLNFAKGVATLASLTWNYLLYAKLVFKLQGSASRER